MWRAIKATLLSSLFILPSTGAAQRPPVKKTGTVCVAPFHAAPPDALPSMSPGTWAPTAQSQFVFRLGNITATAREGEMVTIAGVPADRKVFLRITLDKKPFESFWLDLRRERAHRACLWLYPGYWHWINNGWDEKLGCRCK